MHFYWGLGVIGLFCIMALALSIVLLRWSPWFVVWARASFGIALIALSLFVVSLLIPLATFDSLGGEAVIVELNLIGRDDQSYSLAVEHSDNINERITIHEQWLTISARMMDWPAPLKILGVQPGFVFGSLVLVDEAGAVASEPYALRLNHDALKAWDFFSKIHQWLPLIQVSEFRTDPFELKDNFSYVVSLTRLGLAVKEIALPNSAEALKLLESARQLPVSGSLTWDQATAEPQLEFDLEQYE